VRLFDERAVRRSPSESAPDGNGAGIFPATHRSLFVRISATTEEEWTKKLHAEGFKEVYVWQDGPGTFYPDHTHSETSAHIILKGEMTVTSEGRTRTYKPRERFDVPAHTVH
jgi:quercetin dioxygenase-like cupin family protein